jgi:predicted transcriptional regulator
MVFVQKYAAENFLKVLNTENPKSIASIKVDIGCGKNTAKRYLQELEKEGKIKRIGIEGSIYYGYVLLPDIQQSSRKTKEDLENDIYFLCSVENFHEDHPDNQLANLVSALVRGADPEIYSNGTIDVKRVDADLAHLREWLLK